MHDRHNTEYFLLEFCIRPNMFRHFTGLTMLNSGSDHLIFMRGRKMFLGLDIFFPDTILSFYFHMSHVMRKPAFCMCENKDIDQLRGTAKLISAFVFTT